MRASTEITAAYQANDIFAIHSPAVLVRRHGTYSWGPDWQKAKGQAECLDYLLEIAVKMRQAGLKTEGL